MRKHILPTLFTALVFLPATLGCDEALEVREATELSFGSSGGMIRSADGALSVRVDGPGTAVVTTVRSLTDPTWLSPVYRVEFDGAAYVASEVAFEADRFEQPTVAILARETESGMEPIPGAIWDPQTDRLVAADVPVNGVSFVVASVAPRAASCLGAATGATCTGCDPAVAGCAPVDGACTSEQQCATANATSPNQSGCSTPGVLTQADITCAGNQCVMPEGTYSGVISLTAANDYLLDGRVQMGDGTPACAATLDIEAGTTVLGSATNGGMMIISPASTIEADGTSSDPILFTSDASNPDAGDWAGVYISGRATANCANLSGCIGESGSGPYGGTDDTDDSGSLRYVEIAYAGLEIEADSETNGLTLQGVGDGTTVEHVHVHRSLDDGIELRGGTVNARYLILTGNQDDSIDWTEGWRGKIQFVVAQKHSTSSDNGVEADSSRQDPNAFPRSQPVLSNLTLVGSSSPSSPSNLGVLLRTGTGGQILSAAVTGFGAGGLDIDDAATFDHAQAIGGNLAVAHSVFCNDTNFVDEPGDAFTPTSFATAGAPFGSVSNDAFAPPCSLGFSSNLANVSQPDFVPAASSILATGGQAPADPFFTATAYRGAVMPGDPNPWYGWATF